MNGYDQAQQPNLVMRALTRIRQQLAEIARECGHAALCCPHSSNRKKDE